MPLEQDLLSIGFDYKQTEADAAKVLASMKEVLATAEKVNSTRLSFGSADGFATSKKSAEELSQLLKESKASSDNYTKSLIAQAKAETELQKQELLRAKAMKEVAKTKETEAKTTIAYNKANDATVTSITKEEKALEALASDYKILSAAQKDAIARYQQLVLLVGKNNPVAQAAGKEAEALTARLKEVDYATGQFTRNVGNYGDAITKGFSKAFGFVRTAANILPGLGLSGAFLLIFEAIQKVTESFGLFKDKLDATKEGIKAYNEVISQSGDEFGKAQTEVIGLTEKVKLAKEGFIDKKEVLKEYNDTIGKTIGHADSLSEAEQKLIDKAPAYIKFTFLKAQAQSAADLATKESAKSVEAQTKQLGDFVDNTDAAIAAIKATLSSPFQTRAANMADAAISLTTKAVTEQKRQIDEAQLRYNKFIELQKKSLDDAAKFGKENGFDFFGGKETEKAKQVKTIADAMSELDNQLKAIQSEQDNGILTINEADVKRAEKIKGTIEEIFKLKASDADKNKAGFDLSVRLSPISQRILEAQLKELTGKLKGKDVIDILPPIEQTQKRLDDETKAYEDAIKGRSSINATALSNDLLINTKKFADGLISQEEYEREKINIHNKYTVKGLDILIEELQHEKDFAFKGLENTQEIADKKNAIDERLAKAKLDREELLAQKTLEIRKQLIQKENEIANAAYGLGTELLDARYERERNDVQDLMDAKDAAFARDIKNIETSSLTTQEKANETAVLTAKHAAEKELLDKKSRDIQLKQAKFDRDANALSTLGNAIAAHFALIKQLGPAGIPLAIANDVLAAIKIASLYAKPLPKFAAGVLNKQDDGFGEVGEAGSEIINIPGQKPFIVDTPTTMFLPKGTDVINEIMYRNMARQTSQTIQVKNDGSIEVLRDIKGVLKKISAKETKNSVYIQDGTKWKKYQDAYWGKS